MCKKILALMLILVMVVTLLPSTAFSVAASSVTEPLADEDIADGSPSSDDTQSSEDVTPDEDSANTMADENIADSSPSSDDAQSLEDVTPDEDSANTMPTEDVADGSPSSDDTQLSEDVTTDESPADIDDEEILESENSTGITPQDSTDSDISEPEIAPISIQPDIADADTVKNFFKSKNYAGTYITERKLEDNANWSIKIDDTGDIALLHNGTDTEAEVTQFNTVDSAGKPASIVFSHKDWYAEASGDTEQSLTVALDSNGCFTMPDAQIYWAKGSSREVYSLSSSPKYYNQTLLNDYFKTFKGEYTLNDGSEWKLNIDTDGKITISGTNAENAFVDYFTMNTSRSSFSAVVFTSPDWYSNKSAAYQTLQLNWTAKTSSKTSAGNFFKPKQLTFYGSDGKVLRGFNQYSYFMPADGMFAFTYFKDGGYAGTYSLSPAYNTVYSKDIPDIEDWKIEIDDNGHVYLHAGGKTREAVATAGSTGPERVTTMYVCVPDRYVDSTCAVPAAVKLTWNFDSSSGSKNAKLYFTTETADAYELKGSSSVKTRVPVLRFESSQVAEYAKTRLKDEQYVGKYYANDDPEEYIEIKADGSAVLHTGGTDCTPLYYELSDAKWRNDGGESAVKSVVFSRQNWFATAKKKFADEDRGTMEMTWDSDSKQFTAAEATFYEEGTDNIVRTYTASTKYTMPENNTEAEAYFSQYVHGEYTLNDGSGWKVKVDKDETGEWRIYTDFDGNDTENYEMVENPAPVFTYDKNHASDSKNGEWGNDGRFLANITVPVKGWYTDEACTRKAIVTLNWKGGVTNPMDDHQFNVAEIPIYKKTDGEVECKHFAGTFYSDEDRLEGAKILEKYAGNTYQPTASEGKWWIVIGDDGMPVVHTTDSMGNEHEHKDAAMDITMDKSKKNDTNMYFGDIVGVTDIKVVIPEWRTAKTNDTLANIAKCAEQTFTFVDNGSASYFTPSDTYIYADTDEGNPWVVVEKSGKPGYNKTLLTKNYDNDRAYSDANKAEARKYFKEHKGTYYIEGEEGYKIEVTEDGEIYWGGFEPGKKALPADVAFDAIKDLNENGEVDPDENEPVPGTISVWLNGYTTAKVSTSSSTKETWNEGTQRADLTWNDTNEVVDKHEARVPNTNSRPAERP